jgi:AT-rich interactive domain-containing protein 2
VSSSGAVSTDGEGENSLTSFEGILLNGIPHSLDIDAANDTASNDGSRSCDSTKESKGSALKMKGMLADLLEKKVVTKEPVINGVLGKEIRISDKGLEIVENHVDKVLKQESVATKVSTETPEQIKLGLKRSSTGVAESQDAKKPLINPPINGNAHSSEVNSEPNNESKADNPEKIEVKPEPVFTPATAVRQLIIAQSAPSDGQQQPQNQQQQLIVGPRQIIMAPGALQQGQVMISQGQIQVQQPNQLKGQIIVQPGQRQVLVQNPQMLVSTAQMMTQGPMLMTTQSGTGQFIVTQALQGSLGAPGQAYVVAQSQGLVQGQAPTVLVTQTPQQQGTNAKTIIILHQQAGQKLPTQGQQVMVQLPRSAVHGAGTTLQGMTLSQGAGGQVTVSLPGGMPVVTRAIPTTSNTTIMQAPRIIAPANVINKPASIATSAIVQNPAKKPAQSTVTTNTTATSTQSKSQTSQTAPGPAPPKPVITKTTEGESTKASDKPVSAGGGTTHSAQQSQRPPAPEVSPFLCEWRGCMRQVLYFNILVQHCIRVMFPIIHGHCALLMC